VQSERKEAMGKTSNKIILSKYKTQILLFGEAVQHWNRCPERQWKVVFAESRSLE